MRALASEQLPLRLNAAANLRAARPLVFALAAAAVALVYWRAWVGDDAFITFRHVTNLLAGNGPVFNPGERVQGFSHPLWFGLLAALSPAVGPYAAAVVLGLLGAGGFVLTLGLVLGRRAGGWPALALTLGVLLSSRSFVEYETSGLENSLSNLLACALGCQVWLTRSERGPAPLPVAAWCTLLILTRPDHAFLCFGLLVWAGLAILKSGRKRSMLGLATVSAPLVAWYGFATFYYGSPLPNTYYAKLGMERFEALVQGGWYALDFATHEPLQAVVMAGGILAALFSTGVDVLSRRKGALPHFLLAVGSLLQLGAVIAVGGDFMRGRFFILPLVLGTLFLARWVLRRGEAGRAIPLDGMLVAAAITFGFTKLAVEAPATTAPPAPGLLAAWVGVLALAVLPAGVRLFRRSTPWLQAAGVLGAAVFASQWDLAPRSVPIDMKKVAASHFIVDEHVRYAARWDENRFAPPQQYRGDSQAGGWRNVGLQMRAFAEQLGPFAELHGALGIISFYAGPQVQVIDLFGLADAYVARCPVVDSGRVAHMKRAIPEDYLRLRRDIRQIPDGVTRMAARARSLRTDIDHMTDPPAPWADRDAYERWRTVELVTRGPLFSWERLRALPEFALPHPGRATPDTRVAAAQNQH